ncbi:MULTISPECIES: methyltransferase domain-containing protein [Arsenicicoccus]|uniref:Methyltransferase domain-containing protein n=1 Tax=Arsenicicoccus bolidensis TaxID=229480 RepID=A0ABS9PZ02_9MICO|nr:MULTISPECIES: methyltransferase domain-containing protein [Arsenicicoccus]MCG7320864.1 methyltransferase domain-containing protein [Arsenicicoccus bolidensis]
MAEIATRTMRFGSLQIRYDDRVLEPRPWTTAQSAWAAELIEQAPEGDVLELCTGAGHIGLLAIAGSDRRLVAVDASPTAAEHAADNAAAAGLAGQVEVRLGQLDEVLDADERFAVVIADPPWVPRAETGRFPQDPLLAIDGGDDGLDVARLCLEVISHHLVPGGAAVLQLGTLEQVSALGDRVAEGGVLRTGEVRKHDGGVLVRLDRMA